MLIGEGKGKIWESDSSITGEKIIYISWICDDISHATTGYESFGKSSLAI